MAWQHPYWWVTLNVENLSESNQCFFYTISFFFKSIYIFIWCLNVLNNYFWKSLETNSLNNRNLSLLTSSFNLICFIETNFKINKKFHLFCFGLKNNDLFLRIVKFHNTKNLGHSPPLIINIKLSLDFPVFLNKEL